MKKIVKIILFFLCIIIVSGCDKKEEEVVNVLNWSSYIPEEVIEEFTTETGIKVNYGTYSSNEELLAKVSSSAQGTYDLVFPSDYMVELMIEKNLLEEIDKTKLNNLSNIKKEFLNLKYDYSNKYSIPFLGASVVIIKNKDNISEKLYSYNDLLNSKYKNNIVVLDDQRMIIGVALLALGYNPNETDKEKLNEAKEWLLKLKKNIKAFDSDSPKMFLISNEVDIGLIWNAEAAITINERDNMEVTYPNEGLMMSIDNFVLLKGTKNKENAYKFIDYILRSDVMKKIIDNYPYKNINNETEKILDSTYLENNASNFPDNLIYSSYFVENIGENIKLYDELWANIK